MRPLRRLVGVAFLGALLWWILTLVVLFYGRRDEARPADAVVVMGAAQYDGRPSPVLRARLDHAVDLMREGIAPNLILTGGVGPRDTVSEAEVGRRYAVRAGIPADRILTETAGLSSEQSMRSVAELMRERDLRSAVLVSDPFHMLRLRLLAFRLGITAYSSPTRTSPIGRGTREEWKHLVRESLILPTVLLRDL